MRRTVSALGSALMTLALAGSPAWASQSIDDSTGAAQVGPVEANAPVRVLSDGDNQAAGGTGGDGGGPPPGDTPDEGPPDRPIGPTEDGIDDVQALQEDAGAGDKLASPGPVAAALSAGAGALPFTGLEVWILLVIGACALASGVSLRRGLGQDTVHMSL